MKITIETLGRIVSVEEQGIERLGQVLELVEDLLRGAGFHFHPGTLRVDINDPHQSEVPVVVMSEVM